MSQFLHVFLILFLAQQPKFSQICFRNSKTIYQRYFSTFSSKWQLPNVKGEFLKLGGNFYHKQIIYYRKNSLFLQIADAPPSPLDLQFFHILQFQILGILSTWWQLKIFENLEYKAQRLNVSHNGKGYSRSCLSFSVISLFLNFSIISLIVLSLSYLVFITLSWDLKIGKIQS